MADQWPDAVKEKAETLGKELNEAIQKYTAKMFGKATKEAVARVAFALIHIPAAAVRPYLESGKKLPPFFKSIVSQTCRAVLAGEEVVPDICKPKGC